MSLSFPAFVRRAVLKRMLGLAVAPWALAAAADADAPPPPHAAVRPVPVNPCKTRTDWMRRHEAFKERAQQGGVDLLFLGDSITEGWETAGRKVWEKHYAGRNAAAFGIGGDATQHLLWRILNGELDGLSPRLIVLLIGTNNNWASGKPNTPREVFEGVRAVLAAILDRSPASRILLLAIFPRDAPDADSNLNNLAANRLIADLDDGGRIRYRDINRVFLDESGRLPAALFPDLLHPNEAGYARWAEAISAEVVQALGETPEPRP